MKIQLLDINKFIEKYNCGEVNNYRIGNRGTFEIGSLWDERIFGNVGSRDRKNKFGYIQFKSTFIHPVIFNLLKVCSETTSKIIDKKKNYIVSNKEYIEDTNGETGIAFLIRTLPEIDLTKMAKKEKVDNAVFLEANKSKLLIDKFIVIPAGYRDVDLSKKDAAQMMSEVNNIYKDILYINSQLSGEEYLDAILIDKLQYTLNKLITWLQLQLKGKKGILRGSMLKKRLDFSSRLVCVTDQNIPLGYVGIPWHTALAIYEPLFTYYCYKKNPAVLEAIGKFVQKDNLDFNDFNKFIKDFTVHPQIVPDDLREILQDAAKEVMKDQIVMYKRDCVWFH